jgi:RNA polymerase sigma factor (sigma-70 family)
MSTPQLDLSEPSDAELLARMALRASEPETARRAWGEFYRRHVDYLFGVCCHAYRELLGGVPGVSDLVADAFLRVYERAGSFDPARLQGAPCDRAAVRAWLGAIARNLAREKLRKLRRMPARLLDHERWQTIPQPELSASQQPDEVLLVRQAIAALTEREQIVLRVTFEWYEPDKSRQELPSDVVADLAASLNITADNMRQIRRRALSKVAEFLRNAALTRSGRP